MTLVVGGGALVVVVVLVDSGATAGRQYSASEVKFSLKVKFGKQLHVPSKVLLFNWLQEEFPGQTSILLIVQFFIVP